MKPWPALAAAALLAGCAAPRAAQAPDGPAIVLAPPGAPAPSVAPRAVSRALKRDSAAVAARASAFLAPPSTPLADVARLEPLARAMNRRLAVMELHATRRGYRPADVRAARAAADAVAHFLDGQAAVPDASLRASPDASLNGPPRAAGPEGAAPINGVP